MTNQAKSVGSGAYVLNALNDEERTEFETELAGSEELRNEVTELTDTAVLLGMAATPATPSPELRNSIMDRIASMPQLSRDVAPVRTLRAVPALAEEPPTELSAGETKARLRWYQRPAMALAASAAAVLIIVGGVAGVTSGVNGIAAQNQAQALTSINTAADSQHAAASIVGGGTAKLVWSNKLGKSAIIVDGLKSAPNGKTYELWYISPKGTATRAGLMDASGTRTYKVLDGKLVSGDTVGVTLEPAGGSNAPTTKPIVAIHPI